MKKINGRLKPCPFCGHMQPIIIKDDDCMANTSVLYAILCDPLSGGCCAQSGWETSEDEAISAWNKRTKG